MIPNTCIMGVIQDPSVDGWRLILEHLTKLLLDHHANRGMKVYSPKKKEERKKERKRNVAGANRQDARIFSREIDS